LIKNYKLKNKNERLSIRRENKRHKKRGGKPPLNSAENTRNYAIAE
jgi:hypothetical protein